MITRGRRAERPHRRRWWGAACDTDPGPASPSGPSPLHGAAGHADAFAVQLPPHLAGSVHLVVVVEHSLDLPAQAAVADATPARRPLFRRVVARRGDLQHRADRLDPKLVAVRIDVR